MTVLKDFKGVESFTERRAKTQAFDVETSSSFFFIDPSSYECACAVN